MRKSVLVSVLRRVLSISMAMAAMGLVFGACSDDSLLILTADPPASHTRLVFEDDFDGTTLNTDKWDTTWWVGALFHTDHAWFSDDALQVADGSLRITASHAPSANQWDASDVRPFTTGQVATLAAFDRGTFEIRMRHEAGSNLVQAIWMLPYPYAFPPEIDLMETRLSVDPETVFLNAHTGTEDDIISEPTYVDLGEPLDGSWHTYRLVWEGSTIAWFIDDELVRSQETTISSQPMRLLLDQTWIVPWSGGTPIVEELPVVMEIDYVRVWQ